MKTKTKTNEMAKPWRFLCRALSAALQAPVYYDNATTPPGSNVNRITSVTQLIDLLAPPNKIKSEDRPFITTTPTIQSPKPLPQPPLSPQSLAGSSTIVLVVVLTL
mgnify:CR=1 FL=1